MTKTSRTEVNQSFAIDQWTQISYGRTTVDLHCTWSLSKRVSSIRWTALTCYGHGDKHAHSHYLVPATSKHDNVSELEALPRLNLQGLLTLSLTAPHHTSWHVTAHLTAPHSTSQHLRHLRHTSPTNMQNANSQANTCQTPDHCLQRMPTGLEVSHTPSSPPYEDATLAGGACSPH